MRGGPASTFDVPAALADARRRIESAGADPATVRIVAVTKGFGADAVRAALDAGIQDVGENYAQELLSKAGALEPVLGEGGLGDLPRWHFLGTVQRNKVRALAPLVGCWESVARTVEGEAIARRSPGATVFVEVDVTDAAGRNGCAPSEVPGLVTALHEVGLDVQGLMTVAPGGGGADAQDAFRTCRDLADRLGLQERSMGMSEDLELAVAEGSTMVRLGRALFGDRPPRR
ncbi:MAG: YggS family pyridoxal phosphate enzyme [Acidimicrobiales bacterium]